MKAKGPVRDDPASFRWQGARGFLCRRGGFAAAAPFPTITAVAKCLAGGLTAAMAQAFGKPEFTEVLKNYNYLKSKY